MFIFSFSPSNYKPQKMRIIGSLQVTSSSGCRIEDEAQSFAADGAASQEECKYQPGSHSHSSDTIKLDCLGVSAASKEVDAKSG